jgi:hypothetical protein
MGNRARKVVEVNYEAKSRKLVSEMRRVSGASTRMGRAMNQSLRGTFGPWKKLKDSIGAIDSGLRLASKAANAFSGTMTSTFTSAREQERIIQDMANSLASVGVTWEDGGVKALEFASRMQRTAGVADEETERIVQRFSVMSRGLNLSSDDIIVASEAIINMQHETGASFETLERIVARVAAGEATSLSRVLPGMSVQMQAVADSGASASEMLAALGAEFEGAAAGADQLTIDMNRLGASTGDIGEAIGGILTAGARASGVFGDMATGADTLAVAIADAESQIGIFVREGLARIVTAASFVIQAQARIAQGFDVMGSAARMAGRRMTEALIDDRRRLELQGLEHDLARVTELQETMERSIQQSAGQRGGPGGFVGMGGEELSALGLPSDLALGSIEAAIAITAQRQVELRNEIGLTDEAFRAAIEGEARERQEIFDNLIGRLGTTETMIEAIRDGAREFSEALRDAESFTPITVIADPISSAMGLVGGASQSAESAAAQRAAERELAAAQRARERQQESDRIIREAEQLAQRLAEAIENKNAQILELEKRAMLTLIEEERAFQQSILDQRKMLMDTEVQLVREKNEQINATEKQASEERLALIAAEQQAAIVQRQAAIQSGIGAASAVAGSLKSIAKDKQVSAALDGAIESARSVASFAALDIAGGIAHGAAAVAFFAAAGKGGGGASSRSGGGGGGRAPTRQADVLQALRPESQPGGRNQTFIIQGGTYFDVDQSTEGVATLFRKARANGALTSADING